MSQLFQCMACKFRELCSGNHIKLSKEYQQCHSCRSHICGGHKHRIHCMTCGGLIYFMDYKYGDKSDPFDNIMHITCWYGEMADNAAAKTNPTEDNMYLMSYQHPLNKHYEKITDDFINGRRNFYGYEW